MFECGGMGDWGVVALVLMKRKGTRARNVQRDRRERECSAGRNVECSTGSWSPKLWNTAPPPRGLTAVTSPQLPQCSCQLVLAQVEH
jgi:hypothetical protein